MQARDVEVQAHDVEVQVQDDHVEVTDYDVQVQVDQVVQTPPLMDDLTPTPVEVPINEILMLFYVIDKMSNFACLQNMMLFYVYMP